ncbi:MAG: MFS transporter [Deltaproteobacteria bacterium]|nr:MFS transporter [Deltaproteobacteria bacterium]
MLSRIEKIAYGLGDTATNIVFQTIVLFITFFYTDIYGIPPQTVATMFLVVRLFETITDPLMGTIADRTHTRWGKFRPYLLWLSLPFGIVSVLAFTTPDFAPQQKVIYAFITYSLLMLVYTAMNIPFSALGAVLTDDPAQRVSVQTYRFVGGMTGGLIVSSLTLPLTQWFGGDDKAMGYQRTMILLSIVGVILFLICFAGTKERISLKPKQNAGFRKNIASLWQNDQWRVLCVVSFLILLGGVMRSTLAVYYVKYFLNREDLITLFVTAGMIGNLLGCTVSGKIVKRYGKINSYTVLLWIAAVISGASFFIDQSQFYPALTAHVLWGFFLQMTTPILWAKMADTVDYGAWKTGARLTATVHSSLILFIKLGLASGGAVAAWLLAAYNYQPDVPQNAFAQFGIRMSFTVYPAIVFAMVAIAVRFYKLNEATMLRIQSDLKSASSS